jgi:hypothetical protein
LRWRCDHQLLRGPRGPLAETFGVHPSYLSDRGSKPLIIDQEAMGIFRDETGSAIDHNSLRLPERERQMIFITRQFEACREMMTTTAPRCRFRLRITSPNSLGRCDHGRVDPKSPSHSRSVFVPC